MNLCSIIKTEDMKKVFFAAALIGLSLAACSDDDNDNQAFNGSIDGGWKLTAFTLEEAYDINGDGVPSANLGAETGCYNNSGIIFSNGSTAVISLEELEFNFEGTIENPEITFDCLPGEVIAGTYIATENTVTLVGPESGDENIVLARSGNTLSLFIPEMQAVPVEDGNGVISYDFVGATLTFTKQ